MLKHFAKISLLTPARVQELILRAKEMKETSYTSRLLENKTLVLLFEKASTRTRLSFEAAIHQLGGNCTFLSTADSQLGRGEPLHDTAQVLSRFNDGLVLRTFSQEKFDAFCKSCSVPVINALTDESHPCQVMSDLLTIYERNPNFSELKIAWVGDGNNMAYSWIEAAMMLPFELYIASPKGFEPNKALVEKALASGAKLHFTHKPEEAVRNAHYVNTDVWASMGQEENFEKKKQIFAGFCIDENLMALADAEAKFMHCLPAYRGLEVSSEVIDGEQSIVFDQAENRLHMQKAILESLYM